MIVAFIVLAAILLMGAAAVVVVPLVRTGKGDSAPAARAALGAVSVLVTGSALLYCLWSNWAWHAPPPADSPQTMVARLARDLEHNPQNLEGWLMLGRSYTVLQEYPLAIRAYERADRLAGGKNADALVGEAEALALSDESELDGRAAHLVDQALALAPNSGKALFFGAAIAERRGDLPLARERFTKLLALNPPESIRPLLAQQISAIDAKLGAGTSGSAAPQADKNAPAVRVNVSLAPALADKAAGAPLFVFVRDPKQPGPPLAVKRLTSHFPQSVALTSSDSVMPGRSLAAGQSVEVVARIARSGNPVGASGDPVGSITYHVGQDATRDLVIDRLTP